MCHALAACVVGSTQSATQPNIATKMQKQSPKCTLVAMQHQMNAWGPSTTIIATKLPFELVSKGVTVGVQKNGSFGAQASCFD